ncbi:YitT family protein [Nocardioides sp. R-C-SC26]|uniref:YitT family protein n=1 Tax=Nocardioides sp. R-C-SC26 TaxID=2870414 RepID=UPI001E3FFFF7|nr:YitT family protein [Nocardioides sp. R-C-SC26]
MSDVSEPAAEPAAPGGPAGVPHSRLEDVLGVLTGTFLVSLGLYLLTAVDAVTGGTAGLALLLSYATPAAFGALYVAINLPFLVLAWRTKGPAFTVRTLIAVGLVSAFSELHPRVLDVGEVAGVYGVVAGNLVIGVGMLILFRHGASLGGFNVLALLAQERAGWRAGYVQMSLDVAVILGSLLVVAPGQVLLSAFGGAVLNLVIALNHRAGRYLGT